MEAKSKVIYAYGLILVLIFTLGLGQLALAPAIQAAGIKERRITITDSTGRLVRVPCPPRRIISVNGNASELICAFGAGKKIIGISDTTNFPPQLKDKAKVGKVMTPSIEKIAALKPDLFIAYGSGMALKQEIVSKLQKLGIPVVLLDCGVNSRQEWPKPSQKTEPKRFFCP
ncbi:MAG: ABC transporter substrate-binding protein [Firmicutes bacterium]|nr:ABC transporter substrate-binding protein [Bacillota bacterium]